MNENHVYRVEMRYMGKTERVMETRDRKAAARRWLKWDALDNVAAVLFVDGERVKYIRVYKALGLKEEADPHTDADLEERSGKNGSV